MDGQGRKNNGTETKYCANSRTSGDHSPGTAKKMISFPRPGQPEKTQIAVDGADQRDRDFRFENTLTDQHGDDVRLEKIAYVEVNHCNW